MTGGGRIPVCRVFSHAGPHPQAAVVAFFLFPNVAKPDHRRHIREAEVVFVGFRHFKQAAQGRKVVFVLDFCKIYRVG